MTHVRAKHASPRISLENTEAQLHLVIGPEERIGTLLQCFAEGMHQLQSVFQIDDRSDALLCNPHGFLLGNLMQKREQIIKFWHGLKK